MISQSFQTTMSSSTANPDAEAALEGYVGVHGWEISIEKFKDFTFVCS